VSKYRNEDGAAAGCVDGGVDGGGEEKWNWAADYREAVLNGRCRSLALDPEQNALG